MLLRKNVLSLDFGASTVRAMLGKFENGKLDLVEKHRFENIPCKINGTLYWDFEMLWEETKKVLKDVAQKEEIHSLAVDTWGVDFGLLDKDGKLLEAPVHYRDKRTEGMIEAVNKMIPLEELYKLTGNQIIYFNTIFQLMALKIDQKELLEEAESLLLTPDLINYFLTGEMRAEETIASTTQLFDPYVKKWQQDILEKIQLPKGLFQEIIKPGEQIGRISKSLASTLKIPRIPVVATTSHDTGSAFVSAPALEEKFLFVSSGTWSLIGTETKAPIINEKSLVYNITNESGYNGSTRFLKNITGLWILQELKREYQQVGKIYSYDDITDLASNATPFQFFIDVDADVFQHPQNMMEKIDSYLARTNQAKPKSDGDYFRLIYESMALKYREVFEQIEDAVIENYQTVYIVGGGSQADILSQMIANASAKKVVAGPVEATVIGNSVVQLIAKGSIKNIQEGREIVRNSFDVKMFKPKQVNEWTAQYKKYQVTIN